MGSIRNNNVKLGLFVSIAFLMLSAALYFIGSKQNLFGSTFVLRSMFQNVNGLSSGNNVRYSGINVGTVKDIVILNDTTIEVQMSIQKKMQPFMKQNVLARIGSDGLVGNMIVNISPQMGKAPLIKDNDVIQSFTNLETGDIMNDLGATTENIALLVYNLLEITEQLNDGSGTLAMLIKNEDLAKDLQLTAHHLKQSSQNIDHMSNRVRQNIEQSFDNTSGLLGYLLHDTTFKNQIKQVTDGLDTLIRERTKPLLTNIEKASSEVATASQKANEILNQIDLDQGMTHTILKDSLAQSDLQQAIHNLDQGLLRFNETMEALQHNFLVRKYFKKQEKAQRKKSKN